MNERFEHILETMERQGVKDDDVVSISSGNVVVGVSFKEFRDFVRYGRIW